MSGAGSRRYALRPPEVRADPAGPIRGVRTCLQSSSTADMGTR